MMEHEPQYNWEVVKQEVLEQVHKVKVKELETGNENLTWINFSHWQTDDDRWKKHVDQWVEKMLKASKGKV